jgi:hypothetical protein
VKFTNGQKHVVARECWQIVHNRDVVVASRFQIPLGNVVAVMDLNYYFFSEKKTFVLALAWAITIHKSQGMTLTYVNAELGNCFAEAQVYVALSRVKSLEGLGLRSFNPKQIRANQKAVAFMVLRKESIFFLIFFLLVDPATDGSS